MYTEQRFGTLKLIVARARPQPHAVVPHYKQSNTFQCPWRTINKYTGTLVCILSPFLGLCSPRLPCVTAACKYLDK